ncbi:MAG TPA: AI-2E family transporter [Terrimicrobiaceae bacterium]
MAPTPFQKKMFWAAVTALSFVAMGAVATLIGWLIIGAISYLQPVLIPIAIAAILAYLLEPLVEWLERRRLSRTMSVITVFTVSIAVVAGILIYIIPAVGNQAQQFATHMPEYTERAQALFSQTMESARRLRELPIFQRPADSVEAPLPLSGYLATAIDEAVAWLQKRLPDMVVTTGQFLQKSVGGFLGVFGFLLSLILVPIFLFFFLKEGHSISENWSNYLPLRASPLKSEIVSLLNEINNYLINFFRGQLLVSLIDGLLIGVSLLVFVRLEFSLLIGLMVGVLGLIPYLGMMISWVPAVIIAAAQFGDWWHPVLVTFIFLAANNLDGMIIAPKIVGESVGLHPLTVIISVLAWSLILGGLLGALLAVPLTATIKVLLKRYFWDRPPDDSPRMLSRKM